MKLRWAKPNHYHGWRAKCGILLFEVHQHGNGEFETELRFDYGISLDTGTKFGGSIQQCSVASKKSKSLPEAQENAFFLYERFMQEIKKPTK